MSNTDDDDKKINAPVNRIVDAQGNPIPADKQPSAEQIAAIQQEVYKMTQDPEVKKIIASVIAGHQLYSWGHLQLMMNTNFSDNAKASLWLTVNDAIADETGHPRAFSPHVMIQTLTNDVIPYVSDQVEAMEAEVAKAQAEAAEDDIVPPELEPEAEQKHKPPIQMPPQGNSKKDKHPEEETETT